MPDLWMDVDTALSEVPVNLMPLLDDTDYKTRETAIAYNASGMDLVWNFVTTGGSFTQTAVTPTTGGTYDWTHQGDGIYTIEIPASGGASINNDTEGYGWFSGFVTGVLPWRGPVIGFRAAALNDALIDGGDNLDVNVTQVGGTAQTAGDLAALINTLDDYVDTEVAAIKAKTDNLPADPADASDIAASFSSLNTKVDTIDDFLDTEIAAIKAKTDNLPSDPADASDIAASFSTVNTKLDTIDDFLDTEIAAIKAKTDNLPTDPADASDIAASFTSLNTKVDTIDDFLDTEVAAIKAKTDLIPASPASVGSAMTLDLTQAVPTSNTAQTVGDALNAARAQGFGKWVQTGTSLVLYANDGTTVVRTFTLDSSTTPTSRT